MSSGGDVSDAFHVEVLPPFLLASARYLIAAAAA
jgi:hypothetical protein